MVWFGNRKQVPDTIFSKTCVACLLSSSHWLHHLRNTAIEHSEKLECVHSLLVPKASKWESGFCASVHASVMREVAVIKFTMRVHVTHFLKQVVTVFFMTFWCKSMGRSSYDAFLWSIQHLAFSVLNLSSDHYWIVLSYYWIIIGS